MKSHKCADLFELKPKTQQAIQSCLNNRETPELIIADTMTNTFKGTFVVTNERLLFVSESDREPPLFTVLYAVFGFGLGYVVMKLRERWDTHPRNVFSIPRKLLANINQTIKEAMFWAPAETTLRFEMWGPTPTWEIIIVGDEVDIKEITQRLHTNIV